MGILDKLRGQRKDGRETVKSRAEIVLTAALPKAPAADRPPTTGAYPHSIEYAYRELLFHGLDLHGIEHLGGVSDLAMVGTANSAPVPADWFHSPLRSGWVADPLVLDVSFQMMCLWSRHVHQAASLPNFVGRFRQFRRQFGKVGPPFVPRVVLQAVE